jgi:hypothetical protein
MNYLVGGVDDSKVVHKIYLEHCLKIDVVLKIISTFLIHFLELLLLLMP